MQIILVAERPVHIAAESNMLQLPGIDLRENVDDASKLPSLDVSSIRLPCPAIDLLRLIADGPTSDTCGWLLRTNPALFLYSQFRYRQHVGSCADSFVQLERWANEHLVSLLAAEAGGFTQTKPVDSKRHQKILKSIERMALARSRKGLRRAAEKFVAASTGLPKSWVKTQLPLWLGKQIKPDRRFAERREQPDFAAEAQVGWSPQVSSKAANVADPDLIAGLLQLAASNRENQVEFDARLQNEKLASMKQLAYGASHEINNPLANISTRAQTLLKDEPHLERRQKLATIYEQAIRAHEMISDMMLFANPPKLQLAQTDLRLLIARLIRDIEATVARQHEHHNKNIQWQVRLGPNIGSVLVDPTHFSVLLHSLFKNSFEAIETAGTVDVRVWHSASDQLSISVTDDGVGLSTLAKRHLFDPFYSGREAGRGLGFGLSKAWRIAQLHHATLDYDKHFDGGTKFVLTLPLNGNTVQVADVDAKPESKSPARERSA